VKSKWDDIDRTVTPALERFTSRRIESALGYTHPTKDMYGCGVWGCAYPTSVPGWTVKITADPNEGPTVWNVMKSPRLRGHQAIAYIIGIWQIIGGPEGRVYVILREDITPLDGTYGDGLDTLDAAVSLYETKEIAARLNQAIYTESNDEAPLRDRWLDRVGELMHHKETIRLADFMLEFYASMGFVMADIHVGNVGYRRRSLKKYGLASHAPAKYWVAYDLGHSITTDAPPIPMVKNPGGWLDGIPVI
jgi:hypothetical protein